MKAMVLAAGLGTRLGNQTKDRPKALVEIGGKPLLAHIISKLAKSGFTEIVVNVHHFAQQIIDCLNQTQFGVTIHISNESAKLLDTGGGILKAKPFLDGEEPFLVHNVDILSDINLHHLMEKHLQSNAMATLAVSNRDSTRKLLFDSQMQLRGWKNIATGEVIIPNDYNFNPYELAFSGIHIINPRIFRLMGDNRKFSIIDTYLSICQKEIINGLDVSQNFVLDVGKPESLAEAAKFLEQADPF